MEHLPEEAVAHILSFVLSPFDLLRCGCVSQRWKQISDDESLWRGLYLKKWDLDVDGMLDDSYLDIMKINFTWREHFKKNIRNIPNVAIQVLSDYSDEVWKARWSHNGKYVATGAKDGYCAIYEFVHENEAPQLTLYHLFKMGSPVSVIDWSFRDDYIAATTLNSLAHIINVKDKVILSTFNCVQFDTYCRWLPDDSITLGSRISVGNFETHSFLNHTLWRKYPVSTGQQAFTTFTFLDNCIHVPCYVPLSNSLVFCSGIHPVSNILNMIFITRLPGQNLYDYQDDLIWKDRPFTKDIILAETGAILGLQTTEDGRWLLVNIRPFVDPSPCFVPKRAVTCRGGDVVNYNLLNMVGADNTTPSRSTPIVPNASAEVFKECLACFDIFERNLTHPDNMDTDEEDTTVSLSNQFELHVWDLQELKLVKKYMGHTATSPSENPFLCGPDMSRLDELPYFATGSEDGSILYFHKAHSGPVQTVPAHDALVNSVDFHPSGEFMVSASDDRTIRLWATKDKVDTLAKQMKNP